VAVLVLAAGLSFTFGLVRAVASEVPALDPAAQRSDVDTVIYAENGRSVLAVLRGDESRVLVKTEEIAPIMRQAIVSVEDQRFYEHDGVDVRGIARALWQDVRQQGIVEGGSTITQQFVKNAYIRNEKTIARKVREAALAWQLEQDWPKDRILTAYLNTIYFGHNAYGIQQAARAYFKKGAKDLTLAESALLAGIPADPSLYDPAVNPRNAALRRRHVLGLMLEQNAITQRQFDRADRVPLPEPEDIRLPDTRGDAPYFTNYVTDQLVAEYGAGKVFGGGLRITTTIDLNLQLQARAAIEKVLRDPDGPAAALVAIDPKSGEVKAMFGGRNFRQSQFNLAAQAKRQPGSAFKPIVLAAAMSEGISPVTELQSKPVSIDAGDRIWKVTNYDKTYLGSVSLSRAMVSSDNSVYAQLTDVVGPKAIVETAHRLGIRSRLSPYFSIGLGSVAVSPLELARAYATVANEGRRVDGSVFGNRPRVVEKVERFRSSNVEENAPIPTQVMEESHAELLTDILEDVVQSGTGKRAAIAGREVAGKTGTTDNYGDAWFVGYTPDLVVAVWVGYPNSLTPMLTEFGGEEVAGGTLPALIWKEFVEKVPEDDDVYFDAPPYLGGISQWVVRREGEWQRDNGYCRGTRLIAYFSGLGPENRADCKPNEVDVPLVIGMTKAGAEAELAAQPLEANVAYSPALPGKFPGLVVNQDPRRGGLSANDAVTIFVTTAKHGTLPNFIGSSVGDVRREGKRLKLRLAAKTAPGREGTVLRQTPEPGVAVAPGLRVRLVVGDGSRS